MSIETTREGARLAMSQGREGHWNRWGPFLAERAWGTVREDYSADGNAWDYFPHDHARSRAYRWNEDGIAGICDRHQYLCFALALWNGHDPCLKERMFGLTGTEGNHGEDVKEYYFYLDNTPTHSYMKYLYKYPQNEYPYEKLVAENRRRTKDDIEYDLIDTGIFEDNRYFDVIVEYAKAAAEDLLIRITVINRGPEPAPLHVLPTLWFRNTWSWGRDNRRPMVERLAFTDQRVGAIRATHHELGEYHLYCAGAPELLFTENDTDIQRLHGLPAKQPYFKDAFHTYVVNGKSDSINPAASGTKAAAHYVMTIEPGRTATFDLRLMAIRDTPPPQSPFSGFEAGLRQRKEDADEFYKAVLPARLTEDQARIARQAFAGLLWSKQFYHFVVKDWLEGDPAQPAPPPQRRTGRNHEWTHFFAGDVISMPDKWEFPWFASWDLAFHCIALAYVDPQFAKEQILLMLREWYMHPNGQVPAYEWDFSDVNPPILPEAARAIFDIEKRMTGRTDFEFMERVFHKLLLNFTWWVNRKDALGKNIFQGGFLGMDNISIFDRGRLPPGYLLGQADGTSWMAAFAISMLSNALLLAQKNHDYEDLASKFWEHFIYITNAMNSRSDPSCSLWDETDGFFYDQLISPSGELSPLRARTMVGFVPMFVVSGVHAETCLPFPAFNRRRQWFVEHRPDLMESLEAMIAPGADDRLIMSVVRRDQLKRMLRYMLDEKEFLSDYGIRSVSRYHLEHPLVYRIDNQDYRLDYEPGESTSQLLGGNSNWRGPIWMPVNVLIIRSLLEYHRYFGDDFRVECPVGSGNMKNLREVADELALRISRLFATNQEGRRPVFGDRTLFNTDPHWRDLIPFHEYFHGDTGRGCGAAHQTGWTGLIAQILMSSHAPAG